MVLNTSGLPSQPSTETSSDPIAPKPGSYEDATSRLASTSEVTTESQWTGIWPYTEETQSPEQDARQLSPHKSSPIEREDYTILRPAFDYMGSTGTEPPRQPWLLEFCMKCVS
ncbi:hypothetical protein ARMSODRAFT_1020814 [Armillaria solidipes]|uniref:Uncharacterized protein n=1 Tax=Armillaria solidipes TaxID=1076256 RepID=A0A2H3B904_9AGAR|nr:hypothetical protein ARMSODRAFT_1020814 [Armillaria solidipes]